MYRSFSKPIALALCLFLWAFTAPNAFSSGVSPQPQALQIKRALIIGNGPQYSEGQGNVQHDVQSLSAVLTKAGFAVQTQLDADASTMTELLSRFAQTALTSNTVLIYFKGEAVQVAGETYLLPQGIRPRRAHDLKYDAIPLRMLLNSLPAVTSTQKVVVIDTTTPAKLGDDVTIDEPGLSAPGHATLPQGTRIVFSGQPGTPILSPDLFTETFVKAVAVPGTTLGQSLKNARASIMSESGGTQSPWVSEKPPLDDFVLINQPQTTIALAHQTPDGPVTRSLVVSAEEAPSGPPSASPEEAVAIDPNEQLFWNSVKAEGDVELLKAYLENYPEGYYVEAAEKTIKQLEGGFQTDIENLEAAERLYWESIIDADDPALYEGYLAKFPEGQFVPIARIKLQKLGHSPKEPATPTALSAPDAGADTEAEDNAPVSRLDTPDLIGKAHAAFADNRLLTPEDDNAVLWSKAALDSEPDHAEALEIIQATIDKYHQWAGSQIRRGSLARAESNLRKSRSLKDYATPEQNARASRLRAELRRAGSAAASASAKAESEPEASEDCTAVGWWSGNCKPDAETTFHEIH